MAIDLVKPKCFVFVLFLRFADLYAYNAQYTDADDAELYGKSITIDEYIQDTTKAEPIPAERTIETGAVIWYIASFGGLVLFFLIVSCSEWCCRRNARRNCQRNSNPQTVQVIVDTPPSYDHFAPPAYEDLWVGSSQGTRGEKNEYDIYVVPVHALGTLLVQPTEEAPPSYQSANASVQHSDATSNHPVSRVT